MDFIYSIKYRVKESYKEPKYKYTNTPYGIRDI